MPNVDGIAYNSGQAEGQAPFLVVARTDGEVDKVGLDGSVSPVLTGAGRGDLVTVGPDNCVYADLQDRIVKIAPADRACSFSTPPVPPPFVTPAPGDDGGGGGVDGGGDDGQQGVLGDRQTGGPPVADLFVTTRASRFVRRGRRFTIRVSVTNAGPSFATDVVLTDLLPSGVKLAGIRAAKSPCRGKGRARSCPLGTLTSGTTRSLHFTVRATRGSRYVNTASAKGRVLDPRPSNNSALSVTRARR
jgi:uncharacterized repeat protein (TIGR01451 family)